MKKNIASLLLAIALAALPCLSALAWSPQDIEFDPGENILRNTGLGQQGPVDFITSVINWALGLLGLLALILLIYGGFIWMFARGEEQEIEKAQNIIKGALIGLVIILASYGIASYVFNNLVNITSP